MVIVLTMNIEIVAENGLLLALGNGPSTFAITGNSVLYATLNISLVASAVTIRWPALLKTAFTGLIQVSQLCAAFGANITSTISLVGSSSFLNQIIVSYYSFAPMYY